MAQLIWPTHLITPSKEEYAKNPTVIRKDYLKKDTHEVFISMFGNDLPAKAKKECELKLGMGYTPNQDNPPQHRLTWTWGNHQTPSDLSLLIDKELLLDFLINIPNNCGLLYFPSQIAYLKNSMVIDQGNTIIIFIDGVDVELTKNYTRNPKFWNGQ